MGERRSTRKKKWIKRISVSLGVIITLFFIGGYALLWKSKPVVKGNIVLGGLRDKVSVWRDMEGVPHIEANNLSDLFRVQGYVTAQDRLFQMDLSRRQASGMLSEVVGKKALKQDRFFRTLGLRRAAVDSLDMYSKESRGYIEAYTKGVNDYIKEAKKKKRLPVEFTLLRYEPTPWSVIDSLTIGKYMAYDLSGHWRGQAFRYALLQKYPKEKVIDLLPEYPKDAPYIMDEIKSAPKVDVAEAFESAVIPHEFNGSNNWVISGKKSVSGKPILANDPHLKLRNPSIWYETHLKSPGYEVSGVVFSGIPSVIIGHNKNCSWGVTNVGPDVQDLYLEKQNPNNKRQFLYKGKWEDAKAITETIKVKGEKDEKVHVLVTRHGPVFSEFTHSKVVLAMKWSALEPTLELQAAFKFARAQNWEEFKKALEDFHAPAQNFIFASTDGTIAYRANGKIPIRKRGDSLLPVPGWTGEYEWKGYIPWEELPTVVNPEKGWIATANNRVAGASYPYHLSHVWAQPYRQMRIAEVLEEDKKFSIEDMKKLQFDHVNLQAKEFNPIICKIIENNKKSLREIDKDALVYLEKWSFEDDRELAAPFIFHLTIDQVSKTLFSKKLDPKLLELFEGRGSIIDRLLRNAKSGNPGPWMKESGGLDKVILTSYQNAINIAVELQGNNLSKWKWGEYHRATFPHPLSSIKPLHLLFNPKPVPLSGSAVTVDSEGYIKDTGKVDYGPAWRTIIDMANPLESLNSVTPGQSGHVLSTWYGNQVDDWSKGKYHITSMISKRYRGIKKDFQLIFTPKK